MRNAHKACLFFTIFIIIIGSLKVYGLDDARASYDRAARCVKAGQTDFAFMGFRSVVRDFPETWFGRESIFAIAEYYYDNKQYYDAISKLKEYINNEPDPRGCVFAKLYLLKIVGQMDNPGAEDKAMSLDIKKELLSKPSFLVLAEYKKTSYRSPFQNRFTIKRYPGNMDIYRNAELFIRLTQ